MKIIKVTEKYLSFNGDTQSALILVNSLRNTYGNNDMPKALSDFIFGIEVALQYESILDQDFNEVNHE
jgi:hypothetical protein